MRRILSLNCGSSSLKFGVFEQGDSGIKLLLEGEAEEIGHKECTFWTKAADGQKREDSAELKDHGAALRRSLKALNDAGFMDVQAVGHRVVHGGPKLREHQMLDAEALSELRKALPFAPLHLPASLAVIDAISKEMPHTPQVICLDTAFHRHMPDVARTFALPADVRTMGVERYGFHGLSLESILPQLEKVPEQLVVAHLGNGSSITAIHKGVSVDTSMGFTPTGGVMMGTRTGDIDPGVLIFLMRHGYDKADAMERLVDKKSGMQGVSGVTSDVRELQKTRGSSKEADLALRMFAYQVGKTIAAMAAAMGGMDMLVFTGGIGEHDAELRQDVANRLRFCGEFEVKSLPAEEDLQIARITAGLVPMGA